MALTKCPECGKEISDKAQYCQGCGYPISPNNRWLAGFEIKKYVENKAILYGAIAFAFLVGIFIIVNASNNKRDYPKSSLKANSYSTKPQTGKEGALASAESYLNSAAFSYDGLVEQLEYTGFSSSEAKYAADNCGADWKEQALREAKSYLHSSAFSYSGLIEQLEYSGFTLEEAKYGADHCGANWKEQASKMAASYLKSLSFTRTRLIEQLEYSGFTHEQAVYGADQNMK